MVISTKNRNIPVKNILGETMRHNGKSYPALRIVFRDGVTGEELTSLCSDSFEILDEHGKVVGVQEGYNTLGEHSVVIGKITTPEQERDEFERELSNVRATHETYKEQVETILPALDDQTALRVKSIFPTWEDCVKLGSVVSNEGFRFRYEDKLYKCRRANPTFQSDWIPGVGTESLYEVINEEHSGTIDDPIPYDGNMTIENGKYYIQDDVIYLCNRDSGNPVYNALSELVGLYVEVVE